MSCSPLETTRDSRETPGPLAADLARVIARAGISPELEEAELQEALHRAIALRRCSCTWTKIHAGWVVRLQFPEPRRFFSTTLEDALAWCLAWIMAGETRLAPREYERSQRSSSV
jgi:hypothetical protein